MCVERNAYLMFGLEDWKMFYLWLVFTKQMEISMMSFKNI